MQDAVRVRARKVRLKMKSEDLSQLWMLGHSIASTKKHFQHLHIYQILIIEFILIKCTTECDIRENFDTNECPNIFVSTKLHEWISEYIRIFVKVLHSNTLTNECMNIFIQTNVTGYIRKRKIDMNECLNIYLWPIYSNIQIFEYISHTLMHKHAHIYLNLVRYNWQFNENIIFAATLQSQAHNLKYHHVPLCDYDNNGDSCVWL